MRSSPGRPGPAVEQRGEEGDRLHGHLQHPARVVGAAHDAPATRLDDEGEGLQVVEGRLHFGLARLEHGRAVAALWLQPATSAFSVSG